MLPLPLLAVQALTSLVAGCGSPDRCLVELALRLVCILLPTC